MKWFRKLFRGRSGKAAEASSSKADPWLERFDSIKPQERHRLCSIGEEASEETVTDPEEVYAVTTAKNFRGDTLNEFVFESDWVILTKQEFFEAKFQQRLARSDAVTALCKKKASERTAKVSTVVARPPHCHCNDVDLEDSITVPREGIFRRFVKAVARFWRRFYKMLTNCKTCKMKSRRKDDQTDDSSSLTGLEGYLSR